MSVSCVIGDFLLKYEGFSLEHKVYDVKSLFCKAVESDMKDVLRPANFKRLYYGMH
jgi:hypothetical protein